MEPSEIARLLDVTMQGGGASLMLAVICIWGMRYAWPQWLAEQRERRQADAVERAADREQRNREITMLVSAFDRGVEAMNAATVAMHEATTQFAAEGMRCPVREEQVQERRRAAAGRG